MTDSMGWRPHLSAANDPLAMPYAIAAPEDRHAPRLRLAIPARMRLSCSSSFAVKVTAMSLSGFVSDALLEVHPGTLCWLTLPGLGALEAEVVHHDHAGVGCVFKNKLNPAVLNHYLQQYPVA